MQLTSLARDFVSILYPELCCACSGALLADEELICLHCREELPRTRFHLYKENPMERVFWGRVPVKTAAAFLFFHKSSSVQDVLHRIKYKGIKEAAELLGQWYGADLAEAGTLRDADMLIPVPLHPKKQRMRGFNQSEWFARGLSSTTGIPVNTTSLIRQRFSETQTRKSRYTRWENVKEIFAVKDAAALENKHVVLVDDVVTTGATLEACARQITDLNCGAKISILTLAFAGGV